MPARNDIANEILNAKKAAQDKIRRKYLCKLKNYTNRDTIVYATAFASKKLPDIPSYLVSITLEDMQGFMSALHGLSGDMLDQVEYQFWRFLEYVNLPDRSKLICQRIPKCAMSGQPPGEYAKMGAF